MKKSKLKHQSPIGHCPRRCHSKIEQDLYPHFDLTQLAALGAYYNVIPKDIATVSYQQSQ